MAIFCSPQPYGIFRRLPMFFRARPRTSPTGGMECWTHMFKGSAVNQLFSCPLTTAYEAVCNLWYPAQKLRLWLIPSRQLLGVSDPSRPLERPLWEQHETPDTN